MFVKAMFVVVEHPTTSRQLASGAVETMCWPPQAISVAIGTLDAALALLPAAGPEAVIGEVVAGPVAGVATVRPVVRVLGGYGRGDAYEIEMW